VLPNGDMEIVNVVDHVRMVHQLPEREPVDYDSREDKTPPPGFEDTARAIGVPLSVVRINAAGKVLRPIVVRLPDKPVTIGETWDDSFDVKVSLENGGTKTIQTRRRHKLAGVKSGIATIEVTYQVLSPIDPFIESQLVQRLMEGEVKFDIASGRVASQQMDIDKRILGFAGPTSSMHYVTRMEEKIVTAKPEVAVKQPAPKKAKPTARGAQNRTIRNSRSSGRSRVPQGAKGYRR
jgi:hypothetical protein